MKTSRTQPWSKLLWLFAAIALTFGLASVAEAAYVLRFTTTTNGAITFTGNAVGLSKANAANGKAYGGGPSSNHNYTSGLLLYHYLTGDPEAKAAVLGLADWVLAMDDGARTLLGVIDDGPTGLASIMSRRGRPTANASPSSAAPTSSAASSASSMLRPAPISRSPSRSRSAAPSTISTSTSTPPGGASLASSAASARIAISRGSMSPAPTSARSA